ncbi:hypothetical protein FUAX_06360 [Fulvitalea axinellae]|uniref:Uncharacterized protein n=1 Tax=Fulvitalea axinellae TaxID=1182444 RepID=A0AAU9C8A9_9BACT|nr:hypothetical protein FUAX_06360 [Fulvitalea axinellae]
MRKQLQSKSPKQRKARSQPGASGQAILPANRSLPVQLMMDSATFRTMTVTHRDQGKEGRKKMHSIALRKEGITNEERVSLTGSFHAEEMRIADKLDLEKASYPFSLQEFESCLDTFQHLNEAERTVSPTDPAEKHEYKRIQDEKLACLSDLERLIFIWNKKFPIPARRIHHPEAIPHFGVLCLLMDDIQRERSRVAWKQITYSMSMTAPITYGMGISRKRNAEALIPSDFQRKKLLDGHRYPYYLPKMFEPDGKLSEKSQPARSMMVGWMGRLASVSDGFELARNACEKNSSLRGEMEVLLVSPSVVPGHYHRKGKEFRIASDFTGGNTFMPHESAEGEETLCFCPPYLMFGKMLEEFRISKDSSSRRATSGAVEAEAKLLKAFKIPGKAGNGNIKVRGRDPHDDFFDISTVEGESDTALSLKTSDDANAESFKVDIGTVSWQGVREMMALECAPRHKERDLVPRPAHTLQLPPAALHPKGATVYSELFGMEAFDPASVRVDSLSVLGEQGHMGAVYELLQTNGNRKILKMIGEHEGRFAWTKHHEKEAFASNFIRTIGNRVIAPRSLPLARLGPEIEGLKQILSARPHPHNFPVHSLLHAIGIVQGHSNERISALVMDKVPGFSCQNLVRKYGDGYKVVLDLLLKNPNVQAAIGELLAYDLLLGNFDRFWCGVHEGNNLFNASITESHPSGKRHLDLKINERHPVGAIDQTLSALGLFVFLQKICYKKGTQEYLDNPEYSRLGHVVEEAGDLPLAFEKECRSMGKDFRNVISRFLGTFIKEGPGQVAWTRDLFEGQIKPNMSSAGLDIGFMEALLNLREKRDVYEAMKKIRYPTFSHEAQVFFELWDVVLEELGKYDIRALQSRLHTSKQRVHGLL